MQVDFSQPILDIHGKPAMDGDRHITMSTCCLSALQHLWPNEDIGVEVKVQRFKLALRIAQAEGRVVALSNEDVTVLRHCVGKFWNALVVGRVLEVIDPEGLKVT